MFVKQRLTMHTTKERSEDLEVSRKHIEAGQITAVVDTTYPMVEVAGAMTRLEAGEARGKIAITI